eukprot:13953-Prymnesium_polylepis.2
MGVLCGSSPSASSASTSMSVGKGGSTLPLGMPPTAAVPIVGAGSMPSMLAPSIFQVFLLQNQVVPARRVCVVRSGYTCTRSCTRVYTLGDEPRRRTPR